MDISNLVILSIAATFVFYFVQRIERKRVWLGLVFLILPAGFLIYRWAIYKDQLGTAIAAALIGLGLNVLYFVVYGRTHPPASSDDITVIGSDQ
jgi:membrane associated rhomboid family serine protease